MDWGQSIVSIMQKRIRIDYLHVRIVSRPWSVWSERTARPRWLADGRQALLCLFGERECHAQLRSLVLPVYGISRNDGKNTCLVGLSGAE